jgi:hypothetical protein
LEAGDLLHALWQSLDTFTINYLKILERGQVFQPLWQLNNAFAIFDRKNLEGGGASKLN